MKQSSRFLVHGPLARWPQPIMTHPRHSDCGRASVMNRFVLFRFRLPSSEPNLLEPSIMVVLHVKAAAPASASSSSTRSPDGDEESEFLYECPASAAVADVAAALGALAGLQAGLLSLCRRIRARCAGAGADAGAAVAELERALDEDEAEAYASKEQVQRNRFLSPRALREHIRDIQKKCATALQEPQEALSLQETSSGSDNKHERIQIWWAGKELAMDQKLSDYIGVNDKTKIVVRLSQARDEH